MFLYLGVSLCAAEWSTLTCTNKITGTVLGGHGPCNQVWEWGWNVMATIVAAKPAPFLEPVCPPPAPSYLLRLFIFAVGVLFAIAVRTDKPKANISDSSLLDWAVNV